MLEHFMLNLVYYNISRPNTKNCNQRNLYFRSITWISCLISCATNVYGKSRISIVTHWWRTKIKNYSISCTRKRFIVNTAQLYRHWTQPYTGSRQHRKFNRCRRNRPTQSLFSPRLRSKSRKFNRNRNQSSCLRPQSLLRLHCNRHSNKPNR